MVEALRLTAGVRLERADGHAVLATAAGSLRLDDLDAGQQALLEGLRGEGGHEDALVAAATGNGAWAHWMLERLTALGLVQRVIGSPPIAVVDVIGAGHRPSGRPLPAGPVRLSRFAYLRAAGGACLLESPRAHSRVTLPDWRGPAVLALAAAGVDIEAAPPPEGVGGDDARALLEVLHREGFLEAGEDDPDAPGLAEWEFHDLLFHARSREGRHRNPYGGVYAFAGVRDPLPAVKPPPDGERVALPRPDIAALRHTDAPFAAVLEQRRSLRMAGPEPVTADQLGELLYRTARVRGRRGTEHEEVSNRPYPGGGADYELELYPLIHRVAGAERGLHHYDPLGHALTLMRPWDPAVERLARAAARKAPPGGVPDVLLLVTARFGRLTYKYRSICYAIALKDVGVLYQTLYLAATAMGLAPCALGGGDSELFAAASGLSPVAEPQIGELMINTPHPDEVAAAPPLPPEPRRDA